MQAARGPGALVGRLRMTLLTLTNSRRQPGYAEIKRHGRAMTVMQAIRLGARGFAGALPRQPWVSQPGRGIRQP